ncbi:MAG: hypothetical protein AB1416_08625 [Actinomycetota bacterium]
MAERRAARKQTATGRLDPDGTYTAEDLVVATDRDLPWSDARELDPELPAREIVYRIVRRRGPMGLAALAREVAAAVPAAERAPYVGDPVLFTVRLIIGQRGELPALADFASAVRLAAQLDGPDPDYGLVLLPA